MTRELLEIRVEISSASKNCRELDCPHGVQAATTPLVPDLDGAAALFAVKISNELRRSDLFKHPNALRVCHRAVIGPGLLNLVKLAGY